ncbi:TonB-dependent siderophore receptor, partial [Pseudomonas sp.]|uniref:TonB-dependent siderophore receptor n=1 Tax=Pseudomonas sp. TaxID=306 RepID=UPI003FA73F23
MTRPYPASGQPQWRATLLALALMPGANCLAAQTVSELELPSQEITAVREAQDGYSAKTASTASKSSVPIMQEAQAVQVVTAQLIDDYQVQSLDDAMKFVSGMTQSNTLAGTQDGFVKRGFGSNADGSILRDGIRSSLSRNFSATSERVEVLKGPASLLYGALEPGGLINVISKQPQYQWRSTVSGESTSFGGGNTMLDVTGPVADSGLAFRLIAERQHEDYWRNFGTDEYSLVAPSLSWTGNDLRLTLAYERKEYSTPVDRGSVIVDGKPARTDYAKRFNEAWAQAEGSDELVTARAEYQLNPDWLSR